MEKSSTNTFFIPKNVGLWVGTLLVVIFFCIGAWWILRTNFVPLSQHSSELNQARVITALDNSHISYRINSEGLVEVAEQDLNSAKMQLAKLGIINNPTIGYELLDKSNYGLSEFSQKINYQRALEGELARSIMDMREVKNARVHITFKKDSLYQANQEPAKASVIIEMHPDAILFPSQVAGIQQLVASAVQSLISENVTIINEKGQRLTSDGLSANDISERSSQIIKLETELQKKAESLLIPSFGKDNFNIAIKVQMNFDTVSAIKEKPINGSEEGIILREKESHASSGSTDKESSTNTNSQNQDSSETEYAVGKEQSTIKYATGRVEKITVGLVMSPKLASFEQNKIYSLLINSLGLNTQRGDRVSIIYLPLLPQDNDIANSLDNKPKLAPPTSIEAKSYNLIYILIAVILLLIVIVFLLRPKNPMKKPLSQQEREKLLADLRLWLKEDKSV